MSSEAFSCELRSRSAWPVRIGVDTVEELLASLRAVLVHEPVVDSFAIVFDAPVPIKVRKRVTATVLEAVKAFFTDRWVTSEWTNDLVDESGWQGVRATIDSVLAPYFAGADEAGDRRHAGVWADDRTFVHVELSSVSNSLWRPSAWNTLWVSLSHWHPGSMTSGSWSDDLVHVDPAGSASVLVGLRHMDEDGLYYSLSPRSPDAAATARTVAHFVGESQIGGVSGQLVALIAQGFPADGSASAFPIDLLPGADNPGYELSALRIQPPQDVMDALLRLGTLDVQAARTMREAIVAGIAQLWGAVGALADLDDGWYRVLARLEEASR